MITTDCSRWARVNGRDHEIRAAGQADADAGASPADQRQLSGSFPVKTLTA
jgi:hypothetical protein